MKTSRQIALKDIDQELFRIFFRAGVLAGIIGVSLWLLNFWGVLQFYPDQTHARIMAYGLFGGFIFGFLGTAMPRMLSTNSFRLVEAIPLLALHFAMVFSLAAGKVFVGDVLFLVLLVSFFGCVVRGTGRVFRDARNDDDLPTNTENALYLCCIKSRKEKRLWNPY